MSLVDKILVGIIVATAAPIVVGLFVFVSPREPARRNQIEVVRLLTKAHAELSGVQARVSLGDGTLLMPDREQIVHGYVIKAHIQSSGFTVEAQPVEVGKTGLLSYFRSASGAIRFEIGWKKATDGSRLLSF